MKFKIGDIVRFKDTYYDDYFEIKSGTLANVSTIDYDNISVELIEPFDDDSGFEVREVPFVEDCIEAAEFTKTELYKALNGEYHDRKRTRTRTY
jgi:hypothetical protein